MGWSQTEPTTKTTYSAFNHFDYGDEAQRRIDRYQALEQQVKALRSQLSPKDDAAFYQLVYYPVVGASLMNKKFLYRDKSYWYAKQNRLSAQEYGQMAQAAYDSIIRETDYFNNRLAGGKWKHMMSMKPRELPVFQAPILPEIQDAGIVGWSLAPEGLVPNDSSLTQSANTLKLPAFDPLNRQTYFIDIFLTDNRSVTWTASVSDPRINLSTTNGRLSPDAGQKQRRIWVTVDWEKTAGNQPFSGQITFSGDNKQRSIGVVGNSVRLPDPATDKRFIERNGYVVIHATHYTRRVNRGSGDWKVLPDIGYTGETLEAGTVAVTDTLHLKDTEWIRKNGSSVEYDFYTFSSATPTVTVLTLPTHPLNNAYSMRYAVSVDGGALQMADFRTFGRSAEWKQNVLSNRAERKIPFPFLSAGKHTLTLYAVDPGVTVDEIRIDWGGLKKAYSVIPETRIGNIKQPGK